MSGCLTCEHYEANPRHQSTPVCRRGGCVHPKENEMRDYIRQLEANRLHVRAKVAERSDQNYAHQLALVGSVTEKSTAWLVRSSILLHIGHRTALDTGAVY